MAEFIDFESDRKHYELGRYVHGKTLGTEPTDDMGTTKLSRVWTGDALRNSLFGYDGSYADIQPQRGFSKNASATNYYFVNGILNTYTKAESSAQKIADRIGTKVTLIYSPTEDLYNDLKIAVAIDTGKFITQATQKVREFVKRDLNQGKKVTVMAHSRGAAIVRVAIENFRLTPDQTQNLTIVTFGGYSPPAENWKTSATVISFVNNKNSLETDPVPKLKDPIIHPSFLFKSLPLHFMDAYLGWIPIYQKLEAKGFKGKVTIKSEFLELFPIL